MAKNTSFKGSVLDLTVRGVGIGGFDAYLALFLVSPGNYTFGTECSPTTAPAYPNYTRLRIMDTVPLFSDPDHHGTGVVSITNPANILWGEVGAAAQGINAVAIMNGNDLSDTNPNLIIFYHTLGSTVTVSNGESPRILANHFTITET